MILMDFGFSIVPADIYEESSISEVLEAGSGYTEYGLFLTRENAVELINIKEKELASSGRVEFGASVLPKLVAAFADSPYIHRLEFVEILGDLTEMFYYYKNEIDAISDDELIDFMKKHFNGGCAGSTELLKSRELDELMRAYRGQFEFETEDDAAENDD